MKFKFPLKKLRNEHGIAWLPFLAGGAAGLASSLLSKKKKGKDLPPPPAWYEDPYYPKTQADLYGFGSEGLKGEFPDYYDPIGEYGGADFENYLGLVNRDITRAGTEDAARRNVRGGATSSVISKAIADSSTKLRFADFTRAMAGREALLGASVNAETGVRASALANQEMKNNFNMSQWQTMFGQAANEKTASAQNSGSIWSSLLSAGGSIAGSIYGANSSEKMLEMILAAKPKGSAGN